MENRNRIEVRKSPQTGFSERNEATTNTIPNHMWWIERKQCLNLVTVDS